MSIVLSIVAVVGWAGAGITGSVTRESTFIFDEISIIIIIAVTLAFLVLLFDLIMHIRKKS